MSNDFFGSTSADASINAALGGVLANPISSDPLTPNLKIVGGDAVGRFLAGLSTDDLLTEVSSATSVVPGVDVLTGEATSDRRLLRNDRYEELLAAALARFGYKSIAPLVINVPTTTLDPLTGIRSLSGSIGDDNPIVGYELGIRETSTLTANLTGLNADVDLSLWQDLNKNGLFDPEEELDLSENEGNASESLQANLFPGKYFLDVYQFEGNSSFNLALTQTPLITPADAIGLALGGAANVGSLGGVDEKSGNLTPGKTDLYRFALDTNRDFGIFLEKTNAPATVQLFRDLNNNGRTDGGELLQTATTTAGQTGEIYFPNQVAGTYFARVTSAASTPYSLSFEALGSSSTGSEVIESVAPGQSTAGAISATSPLNPTRTGGARSQDFLLTDVVGNQQVNVAVTGQGNFDAAVQIIDEATGQVVAENDNSGPATKNAAIGFAAKPDTDYTIRVTSFATGGAAVGDFSVNVTGSNTVTGSLGLGQSLGGALTAGSIKTDGFYRADYNLTGLTPGQALQLSLDSGAFDAYLEVIDAASGLVVADNDDISYPNNTNARLTFTPAAGTNYLARVSSSIEDQTGAFTVAAAPGSTAVPRARPSLPSYLGVIKSDAVRTEVQTRAADETLDRADFLGIYTAIASDGSVDANEKGDLETLSRETDAFSTPEPVRYLASKVSDGATAAMDGNTFTNTIVGNWFLGTVRPDPIFKDEDEPAAKNFVYQPVQGTLYGGKGQPILGDLAQDPFGNCYYIAALGSTFSRQTLGPSSVEAPFRGVGTSQVIQNAITNNGDQTYTVRFFNSDTGRAEYVTVDQTFITADDKIAGSTRTQTPSDPNNVLWPVVMERAFAQWLGSYDKMGNGGSEAQAQGQVIGGKAQRYTNNPEDDRGYPAYSFETIQQAFAAGKLVTASTPKKVSLLYGGHAYTVTDAFEEDGQQYVVVYNPHGQDNGGSAGVSGNASATTEPREDGFIRLTYEQFRSEAEDVAVL